MKKSILLLILLNLSCYDSPHLIKSSKNSTSITGQVSICNLPNFKLIKDTVLVSIDTLGYYYCLNYSGQKDKEFYVSTNAELYTYWPNGGKLRDYFKFCRAKINARELNIILNGSSSDNYNVIVTLTVVGDSVKARYEIPFYKEEGIEYRNDIITDSLELKLEKYPSNKGELLRGYVYYVGWNHSNKPNKNNSLYPGMKENFRGYFECKVE
jgi:hypothetical protein